MDEVPRKTVQNVSGCSQRTKRSPHGEKESFIQQAFLREDRRRVFPEEEKRLCVRDEKGVTKRGEKKKERFYRCF